MTDQNSAIAETQGHRNLLILLFAGFVLSGIATTIVGPMLPIFIRRWSLDDGQAGLFSSVQFLAALGGTLASSAIAGWWGYRPALVMGYALMGGGLASDRKSTRLNSSHSQISYAVFCLKKKNSTTSPTSYYIQISWRQRHAD